jgi:secreted PhoX family phosphatase
MPKKRNRDGSVSPRKCAVTVAKNGRVVAYMGDDKRDACVFKFVSKGRYNPNNRAANMDLLAEGDLYVATSAAVLGCSWTMTATKTCETP